MGAEKPGCASNEVTARIVAFGFLLPKYDLQLQFLMFSIKIFSNETLGVSTLFECLKWDASEGIIVILKTRPSKGVQKNMLKG